MVELYGHYYVLSHRYKCHECKQAADLAKQANQVAEATTAAENVHPMAVPKFTFMAWNKTCLELLPDGLGEYFPAFLTHWCGVDKSIIDLM